MTYQDRQVPDAPRIRLRLLLEFLRIVAGRRGAAALTWSGQGFVYTLTAVRTGPTSPTVDIDADDDADPDIVDRLHHAVAST